MRRFAALSLVVSTAACGSWGSGSAWMAEPLSNEETQGSSMQEHNNGPAAHQPSRTIGAQPSDQPADKENGMGGGAAPSDRTGGGGKVVGTFRNTYYDFPSERDFGGPSISLMNAKCQPIKDVPRAFYEAACVQGSGSLASGGTVSFAKRDCACAEVCPRTNQKICFDALDKQSYPWGRGANGSPITPLRSIAADTQVLPMGTVVYMPELDGIEGSDGCFVVEDRGSKVQGDHVDIFTGEPNRTKALNAQIPSNQGVTVVVDAPVCAKLRR